MIEIDIYIVRHGFSKSNAGLDDSVDPALTEMGLQQAALAGERLSSIPFNGVFVSPLLRTVQTAMPIVHRQPNQPAVHLLPTLMEVDTSPDFIFPNCTALGEQFAGTFDYVQGEEYIPCPEDNAMRHKRGKRVIDYIFSRFGGDDRVLLVTHGTYMRYIIKAALGMDADFPIRFTVSNCSVTKITYQPGEQPRLQSMNDTRHLPRELLSDEAKREIYE